MPQRWIDSNSLSVTKLELFAKEAASGVATGFFWRRGGRVYLITNWHVVTGRNPDNPYHSADGRLTTGMEVLYLMRDPVTDRLTGVERQHIELNNIEGRSLGWLEHPVYGRQADVVAVPLLPPAQAYFACLNEGNFLDRFIMHVGDQVFVLGFPWGIGGSVDTLPIFKSGNVASIPGLRYKSKPRFLIDARTFKGMSGGPVICVHQLGLMTNRIENFDGERDPITGTIQHFCGVYSGRLLVRESSSDPTETDLGYVWQPQLIAEIIDGQTPGNVFS